MNKYIIVKNSDDVEYLNEASENNNMINVIAKIKLLFFSIIYFILEFIIKNPQINAIIGM